MTETPQRSCALAGLALMAFAVIVVLVPLLQAPVLLLGGAVPALLGVAARLVGVEDKAIAASRGR